LLDSLLQEKKKGLLKATLGLKTCIINQPRLEQKN